MPSSDLAKYQPTAVGSPPTTLSELLASHHVRRDLLALRHAQLVRQAGIAVEADIANAKVAELASLAREGITSSAMLRQWVGAVANGDPILAAELGYFESLFRASAGEVFADLTATYCREGRR